MMISVTKIGDLAFEVRFDEKVRPDLEEVSGWASHENAIERILCDVLLGSDPNYGFEGPISDDNPF